MSLIIGFLTGVAASMGLGGGFILIIYLTIFTGTEQIAAQGINLLFFLPIALLSIILHTKNKLIQWEIIPVCCIAGIIGVAAGALLIKVIDPSLIGKLFAVLLLVFGAKEVFAKDTKTTQKQE